MNSRQLRQLLLVIVCALLGLGTIAVYSASAPIGYSTYGQSLHFIHNHVIAIFLGLSLGVGCLFVPYETLRRYAKWLLGFSIALCVLVLLFGREVGGAQRWFRLGGLSLQPSEFAQLALIIYLADLLARKHIAIRDFARGVLPPLIVTGLTAGLVVLQPDLGTAVSMTCIALLLLIVAHARWKHLGIVVGVGTALLTVLIFAADYRRRRMLAFLNPWEDPQGSGYQILQSYFALGSGGLVGRGMGASLQKLFYLPGAHTDFIFAIVGEELGLIGTTAIILLFALLLTCGFRIAMMTQDLFCKYLIAGCVGLVGFEAIINMAVVTGLLPTKGLPLPFISYGGTSMVANLLACALILYASRHGERIVPQCPHSN